MSYDIDNIIDLNVFITSSGLGFANFGKVTIFAQESELPSGFDPDARRVYQNITELSVDFASTTEVYKAANRFLGGIPSGDEITVYGVDDTDVNWATTLDKAANQFWWYGTIVDAATYADEADVLEVADWCNTNERIFPNCQVGTSTAKIRDPNDATDIATQLTTLGYRTTFTFTHATDPYAGVSLLRWFTSVNFNGLNTTITGEFKKLSGVATEDLTGTEYSAMELDTKKAVFYTTIELQGSTDSGRVRNTFTHSSFGEYIDDVFNLSAFTNNLKVNIYNALTNPPTKIPQTPPGQAVLQTAAAQICEKYIQNGYLGPRNYIDPTDGIEKFTAGYEILSKPEDILNLTASERADRLSAPIKIRIFRAGAIHNAVVDVTVF